MSVAPETDRLIVPFSGGDQSIQSTILQPGRRAAAVFRSGLDRLSQWQEKRASRKILGGLTDAELDDIGLTRADVRAEVSKSFFWD